MSKRDYESNENRTPACSGTDNRDAFDRAYFGNPGCMLVLIAVAAVVLYLYNRFS
ncbi:hypothetical protein GXP70_25465 [Paenibacillus lycopersici]|uniref:Uncharacterized protein n=1 Tax=Paenibacillus lycopersici TaxID=2704462 RepID=A0A6C0G3C2_9BACL|nr:hypothetical protein [Paenibacillus lycopersici]QHT62982.1 hypothetical protein GXP70_25465 [Paenibacillus lycopersici]